MVDRAGYIGWIVLRHEFFARKANAVSPTSIMVPSCSHSAPMPRFCVHGRLEAEGLLDSSLDRACQTMSLSQGGLGIEVHMEVDFRPSDAFEQMEMVGLTS